MNKLLRHSIIAIVALIATCGTATAQQKPRLVINIVVGTMRGDDLERFESNFTEGGFKRLISGGRYFNNAYYKFAHCTAATTLATLSSGAQPADHGVVGSHWWSYADGSYTSLIEDNKSYPIPFSTGTGNYSAKRLVAPTMGDMLLMKSPESKQYTIAIDPLSAIVMNGKAGVPLWAETNKTYWTTATSFTETIPEWIKRYNSDDTNSDYALSRWTPLYKAAMYKNSEVAVMEGISNKATKLLSDVNLNLDESKYGAMCYTPAGNTMLLKFAERLIAEESLGIDDNTDILNICLDSARYIAETYGPESMEYEDMLYRLDRDINEFLTHIYGSGDTRNIVVTLTAAHGTSPSYNPVDGKEHERFNTRQMEVMVNAYVCAHHGSSDYLLGFANNAIYLNHKAIYENKLSVEQIRDEVAIFLLQMRGVSTARSATALRNSAFTEGRAAFMQRGFYAARSGDVLIDLAPGWIIESSDYRSSATSGYIYDRHVPIVIYGGGMESATIDERVDPAALATTICELIDIDTPWSSEGVTLP